MSDLKKPVMSKPIKLPTLNEPVYSQIKPIKPEVYPIDATKATLEEMGILFNALGIAMTIEYSEERGLRHLIDTTTAVKPAL